MKSANKILLNIAIAAALGLGQAALAGPPDHAGSPEDRGSPFSSDDNPGTGNGPPDFANNGGDDEADVQQEDEENDAAGGLGGPPGLCGTESEGPEGRAGASHIAHLGFSQRDDEGEVVEDGATGRMKYTWSGPTFDYVFNGHELEPGDEFTMTYQLEPVGESGAICLGSGTVNDEGDLHIKNSIELNSDLPMADDESEDGALLVAVVSEDVNCEEDTMDAYIPVDYLFGDTLVEYRDTDLEEEEEEEEDSTDS
jgi:hypothetical protein